MSSINFKASHTFPSPNVENKNQNKKTEFSKTSVHIFRRKDSKMSQKSFLLNSKTNPNSRILYFPKAQHSLTNDHGINSSIEFSERKTKKKLTLSEINLDVHNNISFNRKAQKFQTMKNDQTKKSNYYYMNKTQNNNHKKDLSISSIHDSDKKKNIINISTNPLKDNYKFSSFKKFTYQALNQEPNKNFFDNLNDLLRDDDDLNNNDTITEEYFQCDNEDEDNNTNNMRNRISKYTENSQKINLCELRNNERISFKGLISNYYNSSDINKKHEQKYEILENDMKEIESTLNKIATLRDSLEQLKVEIKQKKEENSKYDYLDKIESEGELMKEMVSIKKKLKERNQKFKDIIKLLRIEIMNWKLKNKKNDSSSISNLTNNN